MAVRTAAGTVLLCTNIYHSIYNPTLVFAGNSLISAVAVYEVLHSTGFVKASV